jgi:hypothetical protein
VTASAATTATVYSSISTTSVSGAAVCAVYNPVSQETATYLAKY